MDVLDHRSYRVSGVEGMDPRKSHLYQHHQSFSGVKYTLPKEYKTISKTNRDTVEINLILQFPVFPLFVLQQDDGFIDHP